MSTIERLLEESLRRNHELEKIIVNVLTLAVEMYDHCKYSLACTSPLHKQVQNAHEALTVYKTLHDKWHRQEEEVSI